MKGQRHSTACSGSSAEPSRQCESAWWGKVCSLALCAACKLNGSLWGWAMVGEGMGSAFQRQHPALVTSYPAFSSFSREAKGRGLFSLCTSLSPLSTSQITFSLVYSLTLFLLALSSHLPVYQSLDIRENVQLHVRKHSRLEN